MPPEINISTTIQKKNGHLYAVFQYKQDGKYKYTWRSLGLPEAASSIKIKKALRVLEDKFKPELKEKIKQLNRPDSEIPVHEYMCAWLEKYKESIQLNTYQGYKSMVYGKINKYFSENKHLTVGSLKVGDIEDFYSYLMSTGMMPNTLIHYHAVMRKAFQKAFKNEIIDANPFDRIDKPKRIPYNANYYLEEELLKLLNLAQDDIIFPAIILAGGLGLRRSEAIGARISRTNWEQRRIKIDTKVVEYKENGKSHVLPIEEMKNASSKRDLPIPDPIANMLQIIVERKKLYKEMFKSSYNTEYDDYFCVDQLGNLLRPNYVTNHFNTLLQKYGLKKIRYHDLRHTFASLLLNSKVPIFNVSRFLGHSDISTTANIYGHLEQTGKQESAELITNMLLQGKEQACE